MEDLVTALMDLRRQAMIQGRPGLTQQEMQGLVSETMSQKARQNAMFEELALQKQVAADQYKQARKAMKRDQKYGVIGGLGNAAMSYLIGRQAGLWGQK